MTDPPGSTPYVRFDTDPLTLLLGGADSTARFVSPELAAPGSTADVAFDTSPPLHFAFPAVRAVTTPATPVPAPAATRPRRTRRPVSPPRSTLAATGGSSAPSLWGLGALALAWVIRRRDTGSDG